MNKQHHYQTTVQWTGNRGSGTDHYTHYEREYTIHIENKPILQCSSDPAFRGDASKYNPEDLLVSAIASCHMLWYLHLCADHGVIVESYIDRATGMMEEYSNGSGQFTEVVLHPMVTVTDEKMVTTAKELHARANAMCFIANSVKFPVRHEPEIKVK